VSKTEQKQEKFFFTISEISKQLDLPSHVLRFWEKQFIMIKPQRHNNRRYYTQENIETIKTIKHLLYTQGYTIDGAKQELKTKNTPKRSTNSSTHPHSIESVVTELLQIREKLKIIRTKLNESIE
jgi:DNA-binding transcriptional MerR regulator